MRKFKNLVILQSRLSSSRLPRKALLEVNGKSLIEIQISRILRSTQVDGLIVATSEDESDDNLCEHLAKRGIRFYRGSLNNVLERFINASEAEDCDLIIRLTGDCPLVMPELLDSMILSFDELDIDYLSNALGETFPDGLDIEIFQKSILKDLLRFKLTKDEKEHVTLGIYKRPEVFRIAKYDNSSNMGSRRWTVDYLEDFLFVERVFNHYKGREADFGFEELLALLNQYPEMENKLSSSYRNISLGLEWK